MGTLKILPTTNGGASPRNQKKKYMEEMTMSEEIKEIKIIGRISKAGKEYFQTAIKEEGKEESTFIPVFFKKGVEKLNYISKENKVDKRGVVYTLYTLNAKNVFMPLEESGKIEKAIIME